MKRLVRSRMLGVVRGVPGNRAPISIALLSDFFGKNGVSSVFPLDVK
jgi:hypothetical protein